MNRNNIWIHLSIAVILVTLAAVVGQIERWKVSLVDPPVNLSRSTTSSPPIFRSPKRDEAEVLVKFRPGVSIDAVRTVAAQNHDSLVDEFEYVNGWTEIDDLDNANPEEVAAQYSKLSDLVAYAE